MSSGPPPEFFFDRSLGKETARGLGDAVGWVVHLAAEEFPRDGQDVPDEERIRHGCDLGWVLLSKDKRIRYRGSELAELHHGRLFCLAVTEHGAVALGASSVTAAKTPALSGSGGQLVPGETTARVGK